MATDISSSENSSFVRTHPAITYFLLTFTTSWTAALLVAAPKLLQAAPLPKLTGILMFPAMLLGPSFTGTFLTRRLDGPKGLQNLDQLQPLKKFLPKLAKLQRRLARKKKFSSQWKKAKAKITKLHSKIAKI